MAVFPSATADTRKLIATACAGVGRIFDQGIRYAKAGVMLVDIGNASQVQRELFNSGDNDQSERLMQALDQLNQRFGRGTLAFASEGTQKSWFMKQAHRTSSYTTRWDELALV